MNPWGLVFLAWLFADGDGPRFRYISAQETIEIHDFLIEKYGGERGIIYEGGIYFIPEKATLKKSIEAAAAVYLFEIITMHPFIDGNKRTGLTTCGIFLQTNGFYLDADSEEGKKVTLGIAQGKFSYEMTVNWIKKCLRKL